MFPKILWFILVGYLIGSIPFSYLLPLVFKGIDIRKVGNRKVGGSNVARTVGLKYGILSGILDALKGVVIIAFLRFIGEPSYVQAIAGTSAVVGHNWSLFLKFYGGRGIAVTLGVLLIMIPKITLVGLIIVGVLTLLREHALGVLLGLVTVSGITYLCPACGEDWTKSFTTAILIIIILKRISPIYQDLKSGTKVGKAFVNRFLYDREPA